MLLDHLLSSRRAGPRLRVALFLEDTLLCRPFALALDHVLRSDFAELALVVREQHAAPRNVSAPAWYRPTAGARLLYGLYERWDRWRTGREADRLVGPVDVSDRLAQIPMLTVRPAVGVEGLTFPDDAVSCAREYKVDVALRFARGRLTGDALTLARHGVWYCRLGDEERYRGGPAHFWELAENDPVSGVSLEAHLHGGAVIVLSKGFADSVCESSDLSATRNSTRPLLLGSTFFIRKLKQLHEQGFAALEASAVASKPYRGRRDKYGPPSNADMVQFLVPRLLRKPRRHLLRYSTLRWRLAFRVRGSPRFDDLEQFERGSFRWIEPPPGHGYADPCLMERGGSTYCFFEDFDHERRKGSIACAVVDGEGQLREVQPVLELPYHLSYPFVFEESGEVFMVPESGRNGTVDLYRAIDFPTRWERVTTLLKGPGLDTTILRHDGLYWFFVALREPEGASEQLLLFFSESLTGPLRFHPKNPISIDVRSCRPAGAIIRQDGCLIRPSQDCSVTYGRQLNFNRIVTLTTDDYREELMLTVPPPPRMEGIHTYGRCGHVEVLDGKEYELLRRQGRISSALGSHSLGRRRQAVKR